MTVGEIVEKLGLEVACGRDHLDRTVSGGFVGDLLSVVMGKATEDCVWVTIQGHMNIIAVASLVNVSCVIVSEGYAVDEDVLVKAEEEEIPILRSKDSSFEVVRALVGAGV
ncbi:DRTGG domain-containing protein [Anaerotalea alkaliphila]|uniref:DRTGG domain-containing protein n=1 Tax=Anaerotalea alkaliphila TaxID=2662126 RepID=A0A7X5HWJ7_9FIRM|nr:DRTGG domain-containing protein [Anaerotalea alkaliphila]NDL67960.1 hypothetical protein [Anaerotalea alkaliphila]